MNLPASSRLKFGRTMRPASSRIFAGTGVVDVTGVSAISAITAAGSMHFLASRAPQLKRHVWQRLENDCLSAETGLNANAGNRTADQNV
jgi:hypothetical protein